MKHTPTEPNLFQPSKPGTDWKKIVGLMAMTGTIVPTPTPGSSPSPELPVRLETFAKATEAVERDAYSPACLAKMIYLTWIRDTQTNYETGSNPESITVWINNERIKFVFPKYQGKTPYGKAEVMEYLSQEPTITKGDRPITIAALKDFLQVSTDTFPSHHLLEMVTGGTAPMQVFQAIQALKDQHKKHTPLT